jgi:hypothetical protein
MTTKQFAAVLGFGFVAACIALNFGYAILCLVGAAGGEAGSFRSPTPAGGGRRVR